MNQKHYSIMVSTGGSCPSSGGSIPSSAIRKNK